MGYDERGKHPAFIKLFEQENISTSLKESILPGNAEFSRNKFMSVMSEGSGTYPVLSRTTFRTQMEIESDFPGSKCLIVKRSRIIYMTTYIFFGQIRLELNRIGQRMMMAGILSMIESYSTYMGNLLLLNRMRIRILEQELKFREVTFEMKNWKLLSIFLGWVGLLAVASFVFLFEIMRQDFKNYKLRRSAVSRGCKTIIRLPLHSFMTSVRIWKYFLIFGFSKCRKSFIWDKPIQISQLKL